ncbi:MAG TPA: hypothetical protein VIA18_29270 [Polyangia bacterium]|jgi:hypothetical protein|nr:hypothetical protein [Polyangia bacterium]
MIMTAAAAGAVEQLTPTGTVDVVVDIPSTVLVILAFVATLAGVWFAIRFSRTAGGELGAAFKFVNIGVGIFAISRIDDVFKVSGTYAKMGIDYKRVLWVPHSAVLLVAWCLIAYGFYRMSKAFTV